MRLQIKATVTSTQFGKVFLSLPNGEKFSLPREQWTGSVEEGTEIALILMPLADAEKEQNELAKSLINEIIGNG